ncbi:hypothetical protein MCOR25_001448 [Pyricularia grisea]|nr:hypothetical protein MCOR25_001448 [Pyricularia grisea]
MPSCQEAVFSTHKRQTAKRSKPFREPGTDLGGLFMWLPPYDKVCPENYVTVGRSTDPLDTGAYNHPVVILSSEEMVDGTVEAFIITSFGEQTLKSKFPGRRSSESRLVKAEIYLPIAPTEPHGPHHIVLYTESRQLKKKSYVNTEKKIRAKFSVLWEYGRVRKHGEETRLCKSSLNKLMEHAGRQDAPDRQPPHEVGETADEELSPDWLSSAARTPLFGPFEPPATIQPLLPRASTRLYLYSDRTPRTLPLYNSRSPIGYDVAAGYGTAAGRPSPSSWYRRDRLQDSDHNYVDSDNSKLQGPSRFSTCLCWFLGCVSRALLVCLRGGWETASNVPWSRVLLLLFILVYVGSVGYGIYWLGIQVIHGAQAAFAAIGNQWDRLCSFFVSRWDIVKGFFGCK